MINLKNITKTYNIKQNKIEVLHQISVKFESGKFIAIMGPSGSGKTTLLNIIGGIDKMTDGEYYFNDIPVHKLNISKLHEFRKKNIGFVFQNYNLLDDCTIFENVELPLRIRNIKKADRIRKVTDLLNIFGISECAKKFPSQLSGGEQQRCSLARAIVAENKLLLADEPTGALDSQNGKEVMNILTKLNKEQKLTIILVTHDQKIADYADKIFYIKDGKIIG